MPRVWTQTKPQPHSGFLLVSLELCIIPHPESPPPPAERPWLGKGHAHRHIFLYIWHCLCQLVVRPWMPNVTSYRSPCPVADGIPAWDCVTWWPLEPGEGPLGSPGEQGPSPSMVRAVLLPQVPATASLRLLGCPLSSQWHFFNSLGKLGQKE